MRKLLSIILSFVFVLCLIPSIIFADTKYTVQEYYSVGSIIYDTETVAIVNKNGDSLDVKFNIYSDANNENLMTSKTLIGDTTVYVGQQGVAQPNLRYCGYEYIQSDSALIFKFHPAESDLTRAQIDAYRTYTNKLSSTLNNNSTRAFSLNVINPSALGIDGYDTFASKLYDYGYVFIAKNTELSSQIGEAFKTRCSLSQQVFKNSNMTEYLYERLIVNPTTFKPTYKYYWVEIGQTVTEDYLDGLTPISNISSCYMVPEYRYYYYYDDTHYLYGTASADEDKGITVSVNYSDDVDEDAVAKIKDNLNKTSVVEYTYEDLALINIWVSKGFDSIMPDINDANTFLVGNVKSTNASLTDGTNLTAQIGDFGKGGDMGYFNKDTSGKITYSIDDTYYYPLGQSCQLNMYNTLYVPTGTTNRAITAQKRVNNYLDNGEYSSSISSMSPTDLATFIINNEEFDLYFTNENITDPSIIKAAYVTQYGIQLYSDQSDTSENSYVGCLDIFFNVDKDYVFLSTTEQLDKDLSYAKVEQTGPNPSYGAVSEVYVPYKVEFTNKSQQVVASKIFMINIGTDAQLEIPNYTSTDTETGIKTQGKNANVPIDTSTKVKEINKGSEEYTKIKNKVSKNVSFRAFNIDAKSSFWDDAKFEDMGDGKVEVLIPINGYKKDTVKAFYFDDDTGEKVELECEVKTIDGVNYVSFITNHFSTYGFEGTLGDESATDKNVDTSDNNNLLPFILLAILAVSGCTATAIKRRRDSN